MRRFRDIRDVDNPPFKWAELLFENDEDLTRVRMMWRRGQTPYRPIIPIDACPRDLKTLSEDEWEELERAETHFEWEFDADATPAERRRTIDEVLAELWRIAAEWARAHGPCCDFMLGGYGSRSEIYFEEGKRLKVTPPRMIKPAPAPGPAVEGARSHGPIEIIVGDLVVRVWDAEAFRVVVNALA